MQILKRSSQSTAVSLPGSAHRLRLRGESFDPARLVSLLPSMAARPVAFEICVREGVVSFELSGPGSQLAAHLLADAYGGLDSTRCEAMRFQPPVAGWRLQTITQDALPLDDAGTIDVGLPAVIANLLARYDGVQAAYQVVLRSFESEAWRRRALLEARELTQRHPSLMQQALGALLRSSHPSREPRPPTWLAAYQQRALSKAEQEPLFLVVVRFVAAGSPGNEVREAAMQALRLTVGATASGLNGLMPTPIEEARQIVHEFNSRSLAGASVMAATEAAMLWRLPRHLREVPVLRPTARVAGSPREARGGAHRLGHDSSGRPIYLQRVDRRSHSLVLGRNGTGKSTLVINQALADINAGEGVGFIDMKGDAVHNILQRFPSDRAGDLVLIEAGDQSLAGFNPLQGRAGLTPQRIADEVLAALSRLFDSSGPRLERVLWCGLVAIQAHPGATLLDLHKFLVDGSFRRGVLNRVEDELVLDFWQKEFEALSAGAKAQRVEPVLTRLQPFIANPLVRRLVAGDGALDFRQLMDSGRVVLADLAQGKLAERNSTILANLLTTSLQLAAMGRADIDEDERRDFYLYVDEAQVAAPETFVRMLSQARAFHLNVSLITQFLHQFPQDLVQALIGNVGTMIAFRIGEQDARLLAERFRPEFEASDLINQDNFVAAVRTLANGQVLKPFSLYGEPLPAVGGPHHEDQIRRLLQAQVIRPVQMQLPQELHVSEQDAPELPGWEWERA